MVDVLIEGERSKRGNMVLWILFIGAISTAVANHFDCMKRSNIFARLLYANRNGYSKDLQKFARGQKIC